MVTVSHRIKIIFLASLSLLLHHLGKCDLLSLLRFFKHVAEHRSRRLPILRVVAELSDVLGNGFESHLALQDVATELVLHTLEPFTDRFHRVNLFDLVDHVVSSAQD